MHSQAMYLLMLTTVAIIIIMATTQLCGRVASSIGQPVVVGEMVAGVLLGPSAFGWFAPEASSIIFSAETRNVLYVLAMLGLSMYMFLVGLDHQDSNHSENAFRLPLLLGTLGVLMPLLLVSGVVAWLNIGFRPDGVSLIVYAIFMGIGASVTAFPMLARILQERDMIRTVFGMTAIRVAAIDDALAWIGLAIVGALVKHGGVLSAVLETIIPAVIFIIVLFFSLPPIFKSSFQRSVRCQHVDDRLLCYILLVVLVAGLISDYIGIYSVFGGFIAGVSFPRVPGFSALINARLMQVIRCLLLPIFFTYSGLLTDVWSSMSNSNFGVFMAILCVAILSKAIPAFIVLRSFRWSWGESVAMAGIMNARGLMILVYMNIGLSIGVVEQQMYSIMVLIAILTTAAAMPLYRLHFSDSEESMARSNAGALARNLVSRISR